MQMKEQVITFKVDRDLQEALSLIPNKSEFIRNSILESLGNKCPLCSGSGILSEAQKLHLEKFMKHHHVEKCTECDQIHIRCEYE
ncbi:MAG: CopG family transcriptional regulator [Spirochaetales bacterium]|nr:CopG family transcriptional regulator [Spirochaetales bacterium]